MTDVTLRATKGAALTHTEADDNFVSTKSGRKNLIFGGNFDTNPWQRNTTFTSVSDGDYTADRFAARKIGSPQVVYDIDKIADSPTVAQAGMLVNNCLEMDITTAEAAVAAGERAELQYRLEGFDWAQLAQRPFRVSFWHKHTKTGTYCVAFRNTGADRSFVAEYTQSVTDTWEKATIAVTASPSAGTWNYITAIGLTFTFSMFCGSTFQTTADTWQTGNFLSTSSQVNAADSTSNFMRFALIQMEEGIEVTDFERRTFAEELNLCLRYYEEGPTSAKDLFFSGDITSATANHALEGFDITKRTAPTIVLTNRANSGFPSTTGTVVVGMSRIREERTATASGVGIFASTWTADAEL